MSDSGKNLYPPTKNVSFFNKNLIYFYNTIPGVRNWIKPVHNFFVVLATSSLGW